MRLGKYALPATLVAASLFSACSSGSDDAAVNTILSAVQDLGLDPSGRTTEITFASAEGLASAGIANFVSEDGETATSVSVVGAIATVEWDGRVTPSNRVRAAGLANVSTAFEDVTTTDASAPTFAITSGTQVPGIGGDELVVEWSGPWVVTEDVEDVDNWTLTIDGTTMDLDGSVFDFDEPSQTLTITLGDLANLHADFELAASGVRGVNDANVSTTAIAGTASGDAVAPTLASVVQNLSEDEYGRVIDFTFSEAMDPVFSTSLARFSVAAPATATDVEQPSEEVLRVTFSEPIVPTLDTVDLVDLVDCHGNPFADATVAVTQPTPVVNAYASTPAATSVANAGGDTITVITTQALDPETAVDSGSWSLVVDGNPVVMADQTLEYDLIAKTLTIELDFDLSNGDAFTITGVAALDVDGQTFTLASGGNVSGDAVAPLVSAVTQNRNVDPTGRTLDVQFGEDVRETEAETTTNYVVSGAQTIQSATLLVGLDTVRLVYDSVVVPGDVTVAISNVPDLAGNAMAAVPAQAVVSTDTTQPSPTTAAAEAIAGFENDTITVQFNDDMIESEIETPANWSVESPIGNPVTTVGASVVYTGATRRAVITLENAVDFQRDDDFQVSFTNARDLGGNVVTSTVRSGDVVAETTPPEVVAAYREDSVANEVVLTFSEPCAHLDDLFDEILNADGSRYDLRDSLGVLRGRPTAATVSEGGLVVRLSFGFTVAASDTLDVFNVTDLAGNALLPVAAYATIAEDTTVPALATGLSAFVTVSGDNNDLVEVVFDRPMSPWGLSDRNTYVFTGPNGVVDLAFATFEFDGNATVAIHLRAADANDLVTGGNYTLSVEGVYSAQGALLAGPAIEAGIAAFGDSAAPVVAANGVRIDPTDANSLLITVDESLDADESATAANYDLNSGTLATSATRIGARVIRATFPVAPAPGDTLDLTVSDLATNATGTITRTVAAGDVTPPLVTSVTGTIVPGWGGDYVDIVFDEPITNSALGLGNWTVTSNGSLLSMAGARVTMLGTSNAVRIFLAGGSDLDAAGNVSVTASTASDFAGNTIVAPVSLAGAVAGDATPPSELQSFVNWRVDPSGTTIDVWFTEDVDDAVATNPASWTATGVTVLSVEMLERDHYRLTLTGSLSASGTLGITAIEDPARNASGALLFDPLE